MASDNFIKLDGIDGDSYDKAHSKWIEVIEFNHGSMQNVATGRVSDVAGRGQFKPFIFTHYVDKATPKIQHYCMSGQKIAKAQFVSCRAIGGAQVPVYEVTLENVKILSCLIEGKDTNEGSTLPIEHVELVAGKITWKVTPIKPDNTKDGAVEASFNQLENA